jgi:hypothetical protein
VRGASVVVLADAARVARGCHSIAAVFRLVVTAAHAGELVVTAAHAGELAVTAAHTGRLVVMAAHAGEIVVTAAVVLPGGLGPPLVPLSSAAALLECCPAAVPVVTSRLVPGAASDTAPAAAFMSAAGVTATTSGSVVPSVSVAAVVTVAAARVALGVAVFAITLAATVGGGVGIGPAVITPGALLPLVLDATVCTAASVRVGVAAGGKPEPLARARAEAGRRGRSAIAVSIVPWVRQMMQRRTVVSATPFPVHARRSARALSGVGVL